MPNENGPNEGERRDESSSEGLPKRSFLPLATSSEPDIDDNDGLLEDDLGTSLLPLSSEPISYNPFSNGSHLQRASEAMRRLGHFLAYITLVTMLILVPWVTYDAIAEKRTDLAAFHSAGVMMLGTVVLSARLVYLHLTHWYMPDVQKYVVRILWMVPIYAVQSWLSLRFHQARIYIDTIRDLYEAFVISSFLYYLIELLGGQDAIVRVLQTKEEDLRYHAFPFNFFLKPWDLGVEFMLQCKHGVLQYVVVKTVVTFLTLILEPMGLYGEGEFNWRRAYPYLAFFLNMSVMYALYCLVKFFHAVSHELYHPINWHPMGKFLCVKGVVFFTWWQGVAIFYLRSKNIIGDIGTWSSDDIANALQDYLVCVEMLFFAIAHSFTFTYKECLPSSLQEQDTSNDGDTSPLQNGYLAPTIRTLPRPMGFRDALWSSTLPKETLDDIKRLRNGISPAKNQAMSPGSISLRAIGVNMDNELLNTAPLVPDLSEDPTAANPEDPEDSARGNV